jgi:hypothetical protein
VPTVWVFISVGARAKVNHNVPNVNSLFFFKVDPDEKVPNPELSVGRTSLGA